MKNKKGKLFIVSGPSGSGKGTVLKKLLEIDDNIKLSVSATTRPPREHEQDKKDYFFITKEQFEDHIRSGGMLEWAEYANNYYGTPRVVVENWLKEGKDVILEIEVAGALQVKEAVPGAVMIFIMPPSMKELVSRLNTRGTEPQEVIEKRIKIAKQEFRQISKYDYVVVNEVVEDTANNIYNIINAESYKYINMLSIIEEVISNA